MTILFHKNLTVNTTQDHLFHSSFKPYNLNLITQIHAGIFSFTCRVPNIINITKKPDNALGIIHIRDKM